jgi:hypothetical protein
MAYATNVTSTLSANEPVHTITLAPHDPRWRRALAVLATVRAWRTWVGGGGEVGWRIPGRSAVYFVTPEACSCPSAAWQPWPCKHVVAVRLALAGFVAASGASTRVGGLDARVGSHGS